MTTTFLAIQILQRLRLAEAYGRHQSLRARLACQQPGLVVDLGCGQGIRRVCSTAGDAYCRLDNSAHFIALAQQDPLAQVAFHCHDVEQVPFPVPPADVLFSRYS